MKVERTTRRCWWLLVGGAVVLLLVFMSFAVARNRTSRNHTHDRSTSTSDLSKEQFVRIPAASRQKQFSDESAITKALLSGRADRAARPAPTDFRAANTRLRRIPTKAHNKPPVSSTRTVAAAVGTASVPTAIGGGATAVVELDGESYELSLNQVGYFQRVYVQPEQKIPVVVNCPDGFVGEYVVVEVEDGGLLDTGKIVKTVRLDEGRQVAFTVQVSSNDGVHRVSLRRGASLKVLDFWVGPDVFNGQ